MANSYFQFQQFTVWHDKCAMKVGTDGVLLGAWASLVHTQSILDVGCGSGLISLMLAQRSKGQIKAIDIDQGAYNQTLFNINHSPFKEQIKAFHLSLQAFAEKSKERYDLIISNPPFFTHGIKSPDNQRSMARHSDTLFLNELFASTKHLLHDTGRLALILPYERLSDVQNECLKNRWSCFRYALVYTKIGKNPKRLLIELTPENLPWPSPESIVLTDANNQRTPTYHELIKDFFL